VSDLPKPIGNCDAALVMDSVRRFDDRVDDYVASRPGYPADVADVLANEGALPAGARIADVGCGTGKLAEVLLAAGHTVVGVEPNDTMRAAADASLGGNAAFSCVDGTAEATGLPDASVDAVTAGQAFHWFEPEATRTEFRRILKPGGLVALIWNNRDASRSEIVAEFERLLREHCPDYLRLERRGAGGTSRATAEQLIADFFASGSHAEAQSAYDMTHDWDGLVGRALSASYVPKEGPAHDSFFAALKESFARLCPDGTAFFPYKTRIFYGRLG
jgi:SAM-dependent methyltransferase